MLVCTLILLKKPIFYGRRIWQTLLLKEVNYITAHTKYSKNLARFGRFFSSQGRFTGMIMWKWLEDYLHYLFNSQALDSSDLSFKQEYAYATSYSLIQKPAGICSRAR